MKDPVEKVKGNPEGPGQHFASQRAEEPPVGKGQPTDQAATRAAGKDADPDSGHHDDVRDAPESGEPTETGVRDGKPAAMQEAGMSDPLTPSVRRGVAERDTGARTQDPND